MPRIPARAVAACLAAIILLAACGQAATTADSPSPEAQVTAGAASPAPVVAEPTVAAPPTPAFEPADDSAEGERSAAGTLDWRDTVLRSDGLLISVEGLAPLPSGEVYAAWLANAEASLPIGTLRLSDEGSASLTYAAPDQVNLLGAYERVYIARAPQAEAATRLDNVVLSAALPPEALLHIRHVLSGIAVTPGGVGFAVGLRAESDELLRHAQFLRDALEAGDLALQRRHAEHIINIIRGSEARDADGNGQVENPGDGYGLLPNGAQDGYIAGMVEHAGLAADATDATETVRVHAGHVQVAGENTRERVEQVRALAEQIVAATDGGATRQPVLALLTLAEQVVQGVDADRDEQIAPIAGEGGVTTAYQHAQYMAALTLAPPDASALPPAPVHGADHNAPTPAPAADAPAPTPAPATDAPAPATVTVAMVDFAFEPIEIRIKAGTTVLFPNNGQKQHSATAVDGSFDTGLYGPGETRSLTFDTPGSFRYYCVLHAPADGSSGMAGTIIVEP